MKNFVYAALALLPLAGCKGTTPQSVIVEGQLFCAMSTSTGPIVVALANASGVPFTVTGKAEDVVAQACAVINGIPVVPPVNPTSAPTVAANIKVSP